LTRISLCLYDSDNIYSLYRSAATTSSQKIDSLKKEISDLQAKTKEITDKIAKTDEKLAIIEKDEAERRGVERDLQDQIKYREMQEDLKQCEQELKVLQEKQGDVDVIAIKRELNKTRSEESDLLDKV
jgi:DNA repair protein RAD50